MSQLDEFPSVITEDHPFYKAIEVYNDEGEVFRAPDLIEYDRTPGVPNITYKIKDSRSNSQGKRCGSWRLRWRDDVTVEIKCKSQTNSETNDATDYMMGGMPTGWPYSTVINTMGLDMAIEAYDYDTE